MKSQEPIQSSRFEDKIQSLPLSTPEKHILDKLMVEAIAYIPGDNFNRPSIMNAILQQEVIITPGKALKKDQEVTLFAQMNYSRHRMCLVRRKLLRLANWDMEDVRELLALNQRQLNCRSQIVTSNMGLVLSLAQKIKYPGVEFTDLVSEGSMALLRSVEKFDFTKGFKFSTYACRAIMKGFSRAAKQFYNYHTRFPAQLDPAMERPDLNEHNRVEHQEDLAHEVDIIMQRNLADLNELEKSVVKMRFSLGDQYSKPMTLKSVGETLGLTKERIRQIQNSALSKLKSVAEERLLSV